MITNNFTTTIKEEEVEISVTFVDDVTNEVALEATTSIIGDEEAAVSYVPTFIKDLERNFPRICNQPVEPIPPAEEMML